MGFLSNLSSMHNDEHLEMVAVEEGSECVEEMGSSGLFGVFACLRVCVRVCACVCVVTQIALELP